MAARASGQKTSWLADGAHWSARPVVPCPQTTVLFFLPVFGVRISPVAVMTEPFRLVVRYEIFFRSRAGRARPAAWPCWW